MHSITNRNPFTSLSNYSFLRNLNKIESPESRIKSSSYSSQKKYFNYNQSYLHQCLLKQQNYYRKSSKNVQNNNYLQQENCTIDVQSLLEQKKGTNQDYYNVDNYKSIPSAKTSDYGRNSNDFMKNSTMDFFDSHYFHTKSKDAEIETDFFESKIPQKRISSKKRDNSKFKFKNNLIQKTIQMTEQVSSIDNSRQISLSSTMKSVTQNKPETIFLKAKKKIFHLYHPQQDDEH